MPDDFDRAAENEQTERDTAIANREKPKPINGATHCLHCNAELLQDAVIPRRWCDALCRDEWEANQ